MTSEDKPADSTPPRSPAHPPSPPLRVIPSQDLFLGGHEIVIDHDGEHYRLRLTRNGKLILQK